MSGAKLRKQDWEHRLHVLSAWQKWQHGTPGHFDDGATYRAVLDGCAVTVRALCDIIDVTCAFKGKTLSHGSNRMLELLNCCKKAGRPVVLALPNESQRCLLEVLYLGNRAVAHPVDGELDHKVGAKEMKAAINTVLGWLAARKSKWPGLLAVPNKYFETIK
jgi:hypothetical protein